MILHRICLRELLQSVPVCSNTATVTVALATMSQNQSDRLVIVNHHLHPVAIVHLSSLLAHLDSASVALSAITPSVFEPLIVLPAEWALEQFLPYLHIQNQPDSAVVDANGKFLGLLDLFRLLQHVVTHLPNLSHPKRFNQENSLPPLAGSLAAFTPLDVSSINKLHLEPYRIQQGQQRQIIQLTQQLLVQRAELEQRIKIQQEEILRLKMGQSEPSVPDFSPTSTTANALPFLSSNLTLINSLLELLERLPLPLMLQTSSGKVLVQNSVWRSQVGALSDPAWIRREAAVWLEEDVVNQPIDSEQNLCHIGSTPGTCVCVCPLKDGRERVLQFVKIPLGTLLPDWHLNWSEAIHTNPELEQASPDYQTNHAKSPTFRLATLTSNLDDPLEVSFVDSETAESALAQSCVATVLTEENPAASPARSPDSLWLILAQDVTEQQQLAKELTAKNADLVQLNRLKDEFLACISHELKTPLTAVLGLSSLLKDQTLGELNQRQVHYAHLIYQSSRHLMAVVNDILDLTRIETGQLELVFEPVNISTVCTRAAEQAKQLRLTENKSAIVLDEEHLTTQFSLEIEPGLDLLVADEMRLRQMLVHLLSNAFKFTEADKPIGLKVGKWGGWIAFTVWDSGIGIPVEKQHLIFQKFQQLENPLTRQFEGAGLGLVLTRRLAHLHGGDVTFISKEGEGSQFTILLPPGPPGKPQLTWYEEQEDKDSLQDWTVVYPGGRMPLYSSRNVSEATDEMGAIASTSTSRSRLVLIVEAVPQFMEVLTDKLTTLGYRIVIARSGTEALEKARRLQPCVIFLNPLLPLLSGWDVLTLLKSSSETQRLPVVITATGIDEEHAHRSHADGFLSLPIQTATLQQVLQQLVVQAEDPDSRSGSSNSLTILRLYSGTPADENSSRFANLSQLLQLRGCRVLESDDLEQAELLARVWKPDVVLLEGILPNAAVYFQQLSCHTFLASLPLVTLDPETTLIANQTPGLLIFPCLAIADPTLAQPSLPDLSTLLQVIQIAAGCMWRHSILAVDISTLSGPNATGNSAALDKPLGSFPQESEWLQALMQYLQTAGFRGSIGNSCQEVLQQVRSQTVDLLLICWTNPEPLSEALDMLATLQHLETTPPVIVLDHRESSGVGQISHSPLPDVVRDLATQILIPPASMDELLEQIYHLIPPAPKGLG